MPRILHMLIMGVMVSVFAQANTLESLSEGDEAPKNFEELWEGFDPRKDPLEIEVLAEWEEEGVVIQVVRYLAGTFKGQKSMIAGVYGYPKGGKNLPALVNLHGGGQYADARAIISNAKRGYATISVSWAGRLTSSQYRSSPDTVKLFWEGKVDDPNYRKITDWGAVDGYHAPTRHPKSASARIAPHELTLDAIESPRNSLWFLGALASRRAITFLEQQPVVNPEAIGVYGHSMGGKLTILTAASDKRVKVAVPTCGGLSNNENQSALYNATLGDLVTVSNISCPIYYLSPANDFHGDIEDLPQVVASLQTDEYGVSSAPHHNHQDTMNYIIPGFKWIDHYLKGAPAIPAMPRTTLELSTANGQPLFTVRPDQLEGIESVEIYYTQDGSPSRSNITNPRFKFWHHAEVKRDGDQWSGELPVYTVGKPLWAYANVVYKLAEPESAANYYYNIEETETMVISSVLKKVSPEELVQAKVKPTLKSSHVIEDFEGGWRQSWFSYKQDVWSITTNKVACELWQAPEVEGQETFLQFSIKSDEPNKMAILLGKKYATEIELAGGGKTETFMLSQADFENNMEEKLEAWGVKGTEQLTLAPHIAVRSAFNFDGIRKIKQMVKGDPNWKGAAPQFEELKWVSK